MTRRGCGQGGRGRGGDRFKHQRENKYVGQGTRTQYRSDRNEYYSEEKRSNYSRGRGENSGRGFRKFTGTNSMSPRGYKSDQHYNHNNSRIYNDDNAWGNSQMAASNPFSISQNLEMENRKEEPETLSQSTKPIAPVEQQVENNDKSDQPTVAPKPKHKTSKVKPEPPSSEESSSDEEEKPAVKPKSTEVSNSVPKIKIKKERMNTTPAKKEVVTKVPTVARTSAPAPKPESSSSDSSSSSSSEDEEPQMPHPMRGGDVHPKKEKKSEDDVVCLGKMNNIENLTADSDDSTVCIVCSKPGHPSDECQTKCRKCSSSSYQCQVVCKKCGETYSDGIKSAPKLPDPFSMFMQFMQFYTQQYGDAYGETNGQIPPSDNTVHCPEPNPTVEVSRKDIENSKTNRKKNKSESKQSRKKSRRNSQSSTDDDSDSDSRVASSIKKRKKRAKSFTRETETSPVAQQHQHYAHHFPPSYPNSLPFTGPFNAPGFNPMMAFSQMMGYNPAAMNFKR